MTYEPPAGGDAQHSGQPQPYGAQPQPGGQPPHDAQQYGAPQQYGSQPYGAPQYGTQQPYGAQPPYGAQLQQPQSNGLAITALVLGIVAIVTCWLPLLGGLVGIAAIVLGAVALRKRQSKGMSITGVITGVVGLLASIALFIVGMLVATAALSAANQASQEFDEIIASQEAVDGVEHSVEFVVTVSAGEATVTFGTGASTSTADVSGEWREAATFTGQDMAVLSVVGDFGAEDQQLTCEVLIDGESVDLQEGTSMVSCTGDTFDF